MSEFKYVYGSSLQHWGKGKQADDHKYTAREWVKGKWQYVYGTGNKVKDKVSDIDVAVSNYIYDKSGRKAKHDYNRAREVYENSKSGTTQALVDKRYKERELAREKEILDKGSLNPELNKKIYDRGKDITNKSNEYYKKQAAETEKYYKKLQKAKSDYDKSLAGKIGKLGFDAKQDMQRYNERYDYFKKNSKYFNEGGFPVIAEEYDIFAKDSYKNLKLAELEYNNSFIGKVENGMNLIKKLFKQK